MAKSSSFFDDHKRKQIIRQLWCKPQLKLLHEKLKRRLIYIGLPDINAYDVIDWLEYIEKVIAFQCSSYHNEEIDVSKLEKILYTLELSGKIKSSVVYVGWMEKIIYGGISEIGQVYNQSEFLKIYNLDFCNNLTIPVKVVTPKGRVIEVDKIGVIDKLLEYQISQKQGEKFIMYLTINSNTFYEDLKSINKDYIKEYVKLLDKIRKPEVVAIRKMKAFAFEKISESFHRYNFHVEFLPPIFYLGSLYPNLEKGGKKENHRMMTFTIIGTRNITNAPLYQQDPRIFLHQQSIFANDTTISCYKDAYIEELAYNPNVEKLFKESYSYSNLWT